MGAVIISYRSLHNILFHCSFVYEAVKSERWLYYEILITFSGWISPLTPVLFASASAAERKLPDPSWTGGSLCRRSLTCLTYFHRSTGREVLQDKYTLNNTHSVPAFQSSWTALLYSCIFLINPERIISPNEIQLYSEHERPAFGPLTQPVRKRVGTSSHLHWDGYDQKKNDILRS